MPEEPTEEEPTDEPTGEEPTGEEEPTDEDPEAKVVKKTKKALKFESEPIGDKDVTEVNGIGKGGKTALGEYGITKVEL